MTEDDNETWLIAAGDAVIHKKAEVGLESLSRAERLIYCLWVADYGMRNAGDLATAADLYPSFQEQGLAAAVSLGLPAATSVFSMSREEIEGRYFALFDEICAELREASPRQ